VETQNLLVKGVAATKQTEQFFGSLLKNAESQEKEEKRKLDQKRRMAHAHSAASSVKDRPTIRDQFDSYMHVNFNPLFTSLMFDSEEIANNNGRLSVNIT
jgi:hypothetical protein